MKRARDQGLYLWHFTDGGRLYECADRPYKFCASCDVAGLDPYVQGLSIIATFDNRSPGPMTDGEAEIQRAMVG